MDSKGTVEAQVAHNVLNPEEKKQVLCEHCTKAPGFIKRVGDGDEVYFALECDCKQTPFMRSRAFVEGTWESVTYKQPRKDAYEAAIKESPSWIKIIVPTLAK